LPLQVERQTLPLLRLAYIDAYSDLELEQFLRALDAVLDLPGRKACLIDLTRAQAGSAKQRQMQGQWIKAHESVLERDFAAAAIVTDSTIIRGAVTAVFWIRPLPFPSHVAATVENAQAWLAPYLASIRASDRR
jgi:hypothetical protein